jgi:hypothetical protein
MGLIYQSERSDDATLPIWLVDVDLQDSKRKRVRFSFYLRAATCLEAEARLKPIVEALCTATGPSRLQIDSVTLSAVWDDIPQNADNALPQFGHFNAYRAFLRWTMPDGADSEISFHGPVLEILLPDKKYLNTNQADLAAFLAKYLDGTIKVKGKTPTKLHFGYVRHVVPSKVQQYEA